MYEAHWYRHQYFWTSLSTVTLSDVEDRLTIVVDDLILILLFFYTAMLSWINVATITRNRNNGVYAIAFLDYWNDISRHVNCFTRLWGKMI